MNSDPDILKMDEMELLRYLFCEKGWQKLLEVIPDFRSHSSDQGLAAATQLGRCKCFEGILKTAQGCEGLVTHQMAEILKLVDYIYFLKLVYIIFFELPRF